MSKAARAGATALVAGPLVGLIALIVLPTISDDAGDVVTALSAHHGAMIAGLTLQTLSIAVMVAGVVWLASALRTPAPRLALAGGCLGVAGALVILFEDGLTATAPSLVGALDVAHATTAIHGVHASAAAGLDPLALLFDVGIAVLGFAAVAAGAPRWIAPAVTVAALAQGIGFGTGVRPLAAVAFGALAVLLALLVRALSSSPTWQPGRSAVAVA